MVSLQGTTIAQHWNMMNAFLFFQSLSTCQQESTTYEKVVGYMKNQFFGSFSKKMFCQHTRLRYDTFCDLIKVLGPSLDKKKYKHEIKLLCKS
jgi:hypothetical protein